MGKLKVRGLESEIRKVMRAMLRDRKSYAEIAPVIRKIIEPYKQVATVADMDALKEIERSALDQYQWMRSRVIDASDRDRIVNVLTVSRNQVATVGGKVEARVLKAIETGLRQGRSINEIEELVKRPLVKWQGAARTVAITGAAGFDRINFFHQAEQAGATRFRYGGPPGERAFCILQMQLSAAGRTYTREEIEQLNNGQGLPVAEYCGGYRCRHLWMVVTGATAASPKPPPKPVKPPVPNPLVPQPPAPQKPAVQPVSKPQAVSGSSRPAGNLVSASFKITKTPDLAPVKEVVSLIDSIHGFKQLTDIVPIKPMRSQDAYGQYRFFVGGRAKAIEILRTGDHKKLTAAHEIGHLIDHQVIGKAGHFSSTGDQLFADWRKAVRNSKAYKDLEALKTQKTVKVKRFGVEVDVPVDRSLVRYYLDDREVWARAYSQYIARKSGDADMAAEVARERTGAYAAKQWEDDDFDEIEKAIDDLFRNQGLIQ